jgi:hypothetical protein
MRRGFRVVEMGTVGAVEFDERRWLLSNPFVWLPLAVLAIAAVVLAQEEAPSFLAGLPLLILVLVCAANLRLRLDANVLDLRYFTFWRRRIPRKAIRSATVVPFRVWRYGGWGIRLGFDGTISYSVWEKEAVRLEIEGKRRAVVIGSRRAHELARALQPGSEGKPRQPWSS